MTDFSIYIPVMRVTFNANNIDWKNLFLHQHGAGDISRFRGVVTQRGAGFGALLKTIIRLIPAFIGSPLGTELLNAARNIKTDVSQGEPVLGSVKKHGRQVIKNMTGIGKKKKTKKMVGFLRNNKLAHTNKKPHFLK